MVLDADEVEPARVRGADEVPDRVETVGERRQRESDPDRRATYDRFGKAGLRRGGFEPVFSDFGSLSDVFAKTINNMLLWACMSANMEVLTLAKTLGVDLPRMIEALGQGSGANWSLSRWGKSTGKWAEKDMDVALELAQAAKMPMPLAALVDQLMKGVNQERMRALLS